MRANDIPYRWGLPRSLWFQAQGETYCVGTLQELEDQLSKLELLNPNATTSSGLACIDLAKIPEFTPRLAK
ncbi:Hypothetical predicted protein, partial [Pelobates cultripes]